jgi:hypothetical protein
MSQSGSYTLAGVGASGISLLTGNSGGAVGPTANNVNIVGTGGVLVTGNPLTSTLTISGSGSSSNWVVVTTPTQLLASNNGYIANNAGGVVFTLPLISAVGDTIRITGMSAGGFKVAQTAGQTIYFGIAQTTTGITGLLTSNTNRDSLEMVCVVANSSWNIVNAVGNLNLA